LLLDCYLIADFNMFQHRPVNRWWFVWFIPTEASNQLELWLVIPSRYIVTPMSPPKVPQYKITLYHRIKSDMV
jgi:hypothetical protein